MIKLLKNIAVHLEPEADPKLLNRLSNRDNINFPEVKRVIGRHKFYDDEEVQEWWGFWIEITKGHREGYQKRVEG